MSIDEATKILNEHGIPFRKETFFDGFNGTRIIFKTLTSAKRASALLGIEWRGYFKEYCMVWH
jgi:hypothetical protein